MVVTTNSALHLFVTSIMLNPSLCNYEDIEQGIYHCYQASLFLLILKRCMTQQALQKSMESKISSLETEIDEFKNLQDEVKATQELILVQLQSLMARCNGGPLGESSEATFGENQGQDHMYPNFNHQEFGNNGNQQIQSSFLKLDFPRFSEGDDPLVWIYKAEHYFDFFNIEESKKVKIASFHMEEEALQWFQCAHCLINYTNLEDFMTVMNQ